MLDCLFILLKLLNQKKSLQYLLYGCFSVTKKIYNIFSKQCDATLIYTGLKLCKVFLGTPGIFSILGETVQQKFR